MGGLFVGHRLLARRLSRRGRENTALALLGRPPLAPDPVVPNVHPTAVARVDDYLDQLIAVHRARLDV